jgi:hypothetical protein
LKNLPKKLFFSLCVLRYLCGYLAGGLFDQTSRGLTFGDVIRFRELRFQESAAHMGRRDHRQGACDEEKKRAADNAACHRNEKSVAALFDNDKNMSSGQRSRLKCLRTHEGKERSRQSDLRLL